MGFTKKKKDNSKSNSALAILAGCAVAFMFIATLVSVILYRYNMREVSAILEDREYEDYDTYLTFITSDDSSDFWKEVYAAAKETGSENGIYVDMLSESLNEDYSKNELIEMAIAAGCDGILLDGADDERLSELLKKAADSGISVIAMNNDVTSDNKISYVGTSSYSMAQLYAQELEELLATTTDEEIDVLVLESATVDESNAGVLVTGIQEAVAASESAKGQISFERRIIESENAFSTEEYVQDIFQNEMLPDVIICLDELTTTCVYQAMLDYNKVGSLDLLGYYQSNTILEGINQGVIDGTVTVDASEMGATAVSAFAEYLETGYVSDYLVVNTDIITRANVADYMREDADE